MDETDLKAFEPIPFQELGLGVAFNINFCRTPMCPNFGPAPNPEAYQARYTVDPGDAPHDRTYTCNFCQTSLPLLSNRSLRAAFAWFKRQSVPFAACPTAGCENEGLNVFEYSRRYGIHRRRRPSKDTQHKARCPSCNTHISLGEPARLHGSDSWIAKRLAEVFRSARDRGGLSDRVDNLLSYRDFDIDRSAYLRALASLGPRMRDYHSYCNAQLMAEDYPERLDRLYRSANGGATPDAVAGSPFNGAATLRTDTMKISLRKPSTSYETRHQQFDVLVTALRIDLSHDENDDRRSTYFILAAHPFAVLEKGDRKQKRDWENGEMFDDAELSVADRQYDHLLHEGIDHGEDARLEGNESYVAAKALLMRQDYAELAHFMVVKDLTARFRRVTLCMDGARSTYRSAAAVFAEDMRAVCNDGDMEGRRAEIAIVQAQRRSGGRVSAEEQDRFCARENERVAREWKARLAAEMEKGGGADLGDRDRELREAKARVDLFRQVTRGGFSEEGTWGWRKRPTLKGDRFLAVLWLSQGPDRTELPKGAVEALLRRASLQSVDSAIKEFRDSVPPARRPENRAAGNQSYYRSSQNAEIVVCHLWLFCFLSNYLKLRTRPEEQRAGLLGLTSGKGRAGLGAAQRIGFRLGRDQAIEITEETGHGEATLPRRRSPRTVLPAVGAGGLGGRRRRRRALAL